MARSRTVTVKVPQPIAEALQLLHDRGAFGKYPSRNALLVGLLTYAAVFPVHHALTAELARLLARLPESEQDAAHDLILAAVQSGRDLSKELSKPATAAALLALASQL